MIYDCFIFNDELDLLELRLMETYDLVDWFVLVEAPINWQLNDKPLYFKDNASRYARWLPKIRHIVARDLPQGPFPVTESAQRRRLEEGLYDAEQHDTIVVSDADEIMSRSALHQLRKQPPLDMVAMKQLLYYYWVDCRQNQPWYGPVAAPRCEVPKLDAHDLRGRRKSIPEIEAGGWHFSWLGSVERIQYKFSCHTIKEDSQGSIDPTGLDDPEHIQYCLDTGADLFLREDPDAQKRFVPITPGKGHPKSITEWLGKYPEYMHGL